MKKLISVVTYCYNEEENVGALAQAIREIFESLPGYRYELLFIDNASRDKTVENLKAVARTDPNVKIIVNTRNFGHIRSPFYGLLQGSGDATVLLACDFQEPPALIPEFIRRWEGGAKVVFGVKTGAEGSPLFSLLRGFYYSMVNWLSDIELIKGATGFGLYDRAVLETLRQVDDPYPYLRGLIADVGYETARVGFRQPERRRGITKNNFYTLYDIAMLGITNHSKIPLRVATMAGFLMSSLSFLLAVGYLIAKLLFWEMFSFGMAPILISIFFFASVQLFFIGILGEYLGAIHTQVQKRPWVVEKERINF